MRSSTQVSRTSLPGTVPSAEENPTPATILLPSGSPSAPTIGSPPAPATSSGTPTRTCEARPNGPAVRCPNAPVAGGGPPRPAVEPPIPARFSASVVTRDRAPVVALSVSAQVRPAPSMWKTAGESERLVNPGGGRITGGRPGGGCDTTGGTDPARTGESPFPPLSSIPSGPS